MWCSQTALATGRDHELPLRPLRAKHRRLLGGPQRLYVSRRSRALTRPLTPARRTALWKTYAPNTNYGLLGALHTAPILDVHFSAVHPLLYTASADHTLGVVSLASGERIRRLRAHRGIVNSLDRTVSGVAGGELVVSGSDDGTVRVWEGGDEGAKAPVKVWEVGCPVTAVCWSADGAVVYAAAVDNEIHVSARAVLRDVADLTDGLISAS